MGWLTSTATTDAPFAGEGQAQLSCSASEVDGHGARLDIGGVKHGEHDTLETDCSAVVPGRGTPGPHPSLEADTADVGRAMIGKSWHRRYLRNRGREAVEARLTGTPSRPGRASPRLRSCPVPGGALAALGSSTTKSSREGTHRSGNHAPADLTTA